VGYGDELPRGFLPEEVQQVDAIYMKQGETLTIGDIINPQNIEDVYDIKTSMREYRIPAYQATKIQRATGKVPRIAKSLWRWTRAGGWEKVPLLRQRQRLAKALKYGSLGLGAAVTGIAFISTDEELEEFRTTVAVKLQLLDNSNLSELERRLMVVTEIMPEYQAYMSRFTGMFDAADLVNVLLFYHALGSDDDSEEPE